ncbi:transcriptional regulator [Frankia sp. R43]|uniref:ATP-binding protein n=1 Tax=Frankia sp. R43 TaxID=269536 RepID=UPI0006CA0321|nr:ATP-binding protein [Frankia sp. R43]KPM56820.1 transcriptional regulator [Frankia sp. R43]
MQNSTDSSGESMSDPDETLPRHDLPGGRPGPGFTCVFSNPPVPAVQNARATPGPPPNPDFAARRTSAGWQDLDPREFDRLRRLVGAAGGQGDGALATMSDEQIARSLGVVVTEGGHPQVLAGAVLLFGRPEAVHRHVPQHEAAIQVIGPETGEPGAAGEPGARMNDFFRWPLLRLTEELLARFRARNPSREIRYELVRTSVPAYAEQAFRELLANAFVHRDYRAVGAVHTQWTSEGIEITSPGGFVDAGRAPHTSALSVRPPRPRSPLLADAFRRAGITERSGRGIRRAYAAQLAGGLAGPDFHRSTADCVIAVLPAQEADLAFAHFALGRSSAGSPLELPDLLVLTTALRDGPLRTADAAELLGTGKEQARRQLTGMVGRGLLAIDGDRGTRVWAPSPDVRRALREAASQLRPRPAPGPRTATGSRASSEPRTTSEPSPASGARAASGAQAAPGI